MSDVPSILTDRLELVSLSLADIGDLLARTSRLNVPSGWPDAEDTPFLRYRARQLVEDPDLQPWLVRAVVLRADDRPMVGVAGFYGRPGVNWQDDPSAVELGYSTFEPFRRQGYATEVVRGLMRWAREAHGVPRFIASISPDNHASQALVRKLGFEVTGEHNDDVDGRELEFARTITA